MIKVSLIISFFTIFVDAFSQKIENVYAEQQGKQVVITYNITGAITGQIFNIDLYYSQNGNDWKQAVNGVSGNIGNSAKVELKNTITWDALHDVERIVGSGYMFKIKATIKNYDLKSDTGTFIDSRDGRTYKWVKIGEQTWMAENLNYGTFKGSWCYDDLSSNCDKYGRLYIWETTKTVCPNGWHLPSNNEWTELTNFLGGKSEASGKMKQTGSSNWYILNESASNSSGFTALPGGGRFNNGSFNYLGEYASFWSSTELSTKRAWRWSLSCYYSNVRHQYYGKTIGFSVRCVKD
jgi:uncharacterized protein (TIGR02145 family)